VITLHCCGEKYIAEEQHVGRKIKCRRCGRVLTIEAVVPVRTTASAVRGRARQAPWPTVGPRKMRPAAVAKVALGGTVLIGVVVWMIIAGLPKGNPKSAVKKSEEPAAVAPATESRSVTPERPAVSLRTGTWILKPRGIRGQGVLRIKNGGDLDSAVKLVTVSIPRKAFWIVYIRAHEEKTLSGIAGGTYLLRFALGRDWDADTRKFLQGVWFYEAGRQLVFAEAEPTEDQRGEYTELRVTLNEVIGGNLPRLGITETVFNEGE